MGWQSRTQAEDLAPSREGLSEEGLVAFVRSDYGRLIGLASLVGRGESEPADIVQSALELAWRHRHTLREADRLRPWLDRILVRQALHSRRRFRLPFIQRSSDDPTLELLEPREIEPMEWASLRIAFQRLSPIQRAVVALHLYAGYTVAETAELTNASVETTRSRLRLARGRLRREMTGQHHEARNHE